MESVWTQDCTLADAATVFSEPFQQVIRNLEQMEGRHIDSASTYMVYSGEMEIDGAPYRVVIEAQWDDGCVSRVTVAPPDQPDDPQREVWQPGRSSPE